MIARLVVPLACALLIGASAAAAEPSFEVTSEAIALTDVRFGATIRALDADGALDTTYTGTATLSGAARRPRDGAVLTSVAFGPDDGGVVVLDDLVADASGRTALAVADGARRGEATVRVLAGWLSVLPPLLAIAVAIAFRQVVAALVVGILAGALIVRDFDPLAALFALTDAYAVAAVAETSHAQIMIFSLMLGGMVGVMSRCGGTHGIVSLLTRFAKTPRSGQAATAALGSAVFFDDYANCLIVGNTMRPLTDRLRISREKLAYIVDSTAAPVASLIPLSTWVGYQAGLVGDALEKIPGRDEASAYQMVVAAVPYMFYPIVALSLVFVIALTGRDLFTMHAAERRARREGKLLRDGAQPLAATEDESETQPKEGAPPRAINAILPLLTVVGVTLYGLWRTGVDGGADTSGDFLADVKEILGTADSYAALLWASMSGVAVALLLALGQRILTLDEGVAAWMSGVKAMLLAMVILVLAWSLGAATEELHADRFLASWVERTIEAQWFPLLVFGLGAATAFATGSSWGTMGILMPLVVPAAAVLAEGAALDAVSAQSMLLAAIASVLGGAVFGDHCSPISDTTVLSSMATACDHIDHVRTQLPYALIAATTAVVTGYVPLALGAPWWATLPLGILALVVLVRTFGSDPNANAA